MNEKISTDLNYLQGIKKGILIGLALAQNIQNKADGELRIQARAVTDIPETIEGLQILEKISLQIT